MLDSALGKPAPGIRVRLQEYNAIAEAAAALEPLVEGRVRQFRTIVDSYKCWLQRDRLRWPLYAIVAQSYGQPD